MWWVWEDKQAFLCCFSGHEWAKSRLGVCRFALSLNASHNQWRWWSGASSPTAVALRWVIASRLSQKRQAHSAALLHRCSLHPVEIKRRCTQAAEGCEACEGVTLGCVPKWRSAWIPKTTDICSQTCGHICRAWNEHTGLSTAGDFIEVNMQWLGVRCWMLDANMTC